MGIRHETFSGFPVSVTVYVTVVPLAAEPAIDRSVSVTCLDWALDEPSSMMSEPNRSQRVVEKSGPPRSTCGGVPNALPPANSTTVCGAAELRVDNKKTAAIISTMPAFYLLK